MQSPAKTDDSAHNTSGEMAVESDPWMRDDLISNDFVLVTRPLDSIRLAEVWLQREQLPNAQESVDAMRVSAIRRAFQGADGRAYLLNKHGAGLQSRLDSGDMRPHSDGGNRTPNRSPSTSPAHRPTSPGSVVNDECTLMIDQQSFLRDMLRAFTARSTLEAGGATTATRSFIMGDDPNAATANAVSTYIENTNAEQQQQLQPSSPTPSGPTMINEQQWKKIWQQFRADIGREMFCIEGKRYTDADEAYGDLTLLFKSFEHDWLAYQQQVGEANAPSLARRLSATVFNIAVAWPASAAYNLTVGLVTAPMKLFRAAIGSANSSSTAAATEGGASTSETNASASAAPAANKSHHTTGDAHKDAPNDPLLCEGLARFVVLLSQQSVLAFPYELLHHQFVADTENIYVGEIRTVPITESECEDEENGSPNGRFDREAAELSSSMKVDVRCYPAAVREVPAEPVRMASVPVPVPTYAPSRDGAPCSSDPMAPPIPNANAPRRASAPPQKTAAPKTVISAPFVVLTVSKEFRVFAIDESNDHTLFHIVANISVDVTSATDPVSVSWSLKPAPSRKDRARQRDLSRKGLKGAAPSYAVDAVDVNAQLVHHTLNGAANTAVVGAGAVRVSAPVPIPTTAAAATATAPNTPLVPTGDTSEAGQRCCDCLGGPHGFHRRGCQKASVSSESSV